LEGKDPLRRKSEYLEGKDPLRRKSEYLEGKDPLRRKSEYLEGKDPLRPPGVKPHFLGCASESRSHICQELSVYFVINPNTRGITDKLAIIDV
jgi:hypothetical protein